MLYTLVPVGRRISPSLYSACVFLLCYGMVVKAVCTETDGLIGQENKCISVQTTLSFVLHIFRSENSVADWIHDLTIGTDVRDLKPRGSISGCAGVDVIIRHSYVYDEIYGPTVAPRNDSPKGSQKE